MVWLSVSQYLYVNPCSLARSESAKLCVSAPIDRQSLCQPLALSRGQLAQAPLGMRQALNLVRICLCVILVTFTVYVCSVNIRSCWNCVTIVLVDCSCDALSGALQRQGVHYEYAMYSGIRASVCPLVFMYVGTPWELTCMMAPPCMYV